jgi:hypothetical protein
MDGKVLCRNSELSKGLHNILINYKMKGGDPKGWNISNDDDSDEDSSDGSEDDDEPRNEDFPHTIKGFIQMYREFNKDWNWIDEIICKKFIRELEDIEHEGGKLEHGLKEITKKIFEKLKIINIAKFHYSSSKRAEKEDLERRIKADEDFLEDFIRRLERLEGVESKEISKSGQPNEMILQTNSNEEQPEAN